MRTRKHPGFGPSRLPGLQILTDSVTIFGFVPKGFLTPKFLIFFAIFWCMDANWNSVWINCMDGFKNENTKTPRVWSK